MNYLSQAKVVNSSCSDGDDRSEWCKGGLWCQKSWNNQNGASFQIILVDIFNVLLGQDLTHNDTIVTFQIQSNLDIQLGFFQLFPGVARKNHPLKTMRIVSLKRGGKAFLRSISKYLLASFSSCLGICSLAMPI